MSHYVVGVIIEDGLNEEDAKSRLEEVLDPFNENLEVPEYDKPCWCVGRQARIDARELADAELGTLDDYRKKFHNLPEWQRKFNDNDSDEEVSDYHEKMDEAWKAFIQPRIDKEEELFQSHPLKNSPDASCGFYDKEDMGKDWTPEDAKIGDEKLNEDGDREWHEYCYGGGVIKSTYNPKSKWDWWVIGGRWTGVFKPDYNAYTDPQNQRTCDLCNGLGRRDVVLLSATNTPEPILAILGLKQNADPEDTAVAIIEENKRRSEMKGEDGLVECNGCNGKGTRAAWPTEFESIGNDISVEDLLKMYENDPKFGLFAYLDGDGIWYEKGEMGWWGCVANEKDKTTWRDSQIALLNKFRKGYRVYAVDCHI